MRLPQEEERKVCFAAYQEVTAGEGWSGYSAWTSEEAPPRDTGAPMMRTFQRVLCPSTEI